MRALANKSRLLTTDIQFDPRRDKDNVHSTLSRAGWRGRNRRPRPVVLLARVSSLCPAEREIQQRDRPGVPHAAGIGYQRRQAVQQGHGREYHTPARAWQMSTA